jgi:zinc/manganese transport system substrate-binding protein
MAYNDPKAPEWLSERTGIPEVELPFTVGGTAQASDLYGLFDDTIKLLNAATGH